MKRSFLVLFMSVASFSLLVSLLCLVAVKMPALFASSSAPLEPIVPTEQDWEKVRTLIVYSKEGQRLEFLNSGDGGLIVEPYNEVRQSLSFEGTTLKTVLPDSYKGIVTFRLPEKETRYNVYLMVSGEAFIDVRASALSRLQIEGDGPNVNIAGLSAENVTINCSNTSAVTINSSDIGTLIVNDPSGSVYANCRMSDVRIDTLSAEILLTPIGKLHRADITTSSGNITLNLTKEHGFAVDLTTNSGGLFGDFPVEQLSAWHYTYLDASSMIKIETDTGFVKLYEVKPYNGGTGAGPV